MSDSVVPSAYAVGSATVDQTNRYMYPYSIMVNVHGERFVDEAWDTRGKTYAKIGWSILAQPGGVAYQDGRAATRQFRGAADLLTASAF